MKEYKTITKVEGPLVFAEKVGSIGYNEIVRVQLGDGTIRQGQVLDTSKDKVVIQLFEGTQGIGKDAKLRFLGETLKLGVAEDILGRIFNGAGKPIDGKPALIPDKRVDISGSAINPVSREQPSDFIQTGISSIDAMNTLVRGQKLPIFSSSGLPHNDIALQIARQAKVVGQGENFVVVFAAMGITSEESQHFIKDFQDTGALSRAVVFLNLADDPAVERLVTPRMALTAAEYLAYEKGYHVLVILTDMTNYCESLREIGAAREEVPGRRGYPGYTYTDLAQIYERAGVVKGKPGSVTQIPILTMVGDDITHPVPDLTGYITEGQIVLSRDLHRSGLYPPIDVLPSLSRLMNMGIGGEKTRDDHKAVSDQCYASYAEGRDLRGLVAVVGEDAISDRERRLLHFAKTFEQEFVRQSHVQGRDIEETLGLAWTLLGAIPENELTRIDAKLKKKYYQPKKEE